MKTRFGPQDYVDMPWKNGGGTTRELLKLPAPAGQDGFLARLSIATVGESGAFSRFPGIDRTIFVLEGAGMALCVDGEAERVFDKPLQPFEFDGEAATDCRLLSGPIRDFNLMVDRRYGVGCLRLMNWHFAEAQVLERADDWLFHVLAGEILVDEERLAAEDSLWLAGGVAPCVRGDASSRVVAIALRRKA